METFGIGSKVFLSTLGVKENYVQSIINDNPSILGLGDLIVIEKERKQSSGGRIDFLLKDPSDNTMYEVEIMLGETDPNHIIRSIEYWDIEKRRFPLRSHFAVLVAESFSRRYFNVIQLLGLNIPIIAIQLDAISCDNKHIINFTKILDIYEEQEDEDVSVPEVTESKWVDKAKWTFDAIKKQYDILYSLDPELSLRYTASYIAISKKGRNVYGIYSKRNPLSTLWFRVVEDEKVDKIKELLNQTKQDYNYNKYRDFMVSIDDRKVIPSEILKQIHTIRFLEELED